MWVSLTRLVGAWCLLVFASVVGLTQSVLAGEAAAIDMEEAITRTLARNPTLVAFGYQIEIQQARLTQSQLRPNPELGVLVENVFGSGEYEDADGAETTLSLGWVLERGKLEHRIAAARAGVSLYESEAEIQRLENIRRNVGPVRTAIMARKAAMRVNDLAVEVSGSSRRRNAVGKATNPMRSHRYAEGLARMALNFGER